MADSNTVPAWCRNLAVQLGRVGIVFLAALVALGAMIAVDYDGIFRTLDALVLLVTGIWTGIRILRYISRNSLWSLRNRLLTVYGLIGVLPIVLILILVGLTAWALTSELAIYLARSELDRRLNSIQVAIESLQHVPIAERKHAAPNIVSVFRARFPGLELYTSDETGSHSYPEGVPSLNLPAGWRNATGLLQRDSKFYAWSHISQNGETFTAVAPLTDEFVADLVPNLGQIMLSETPHGAGNSDDLGSANRAKNTPNPDFQFKNGRWIDKKTGAPSRFAIRNAGRIPPAVNRLDIAVNWLAVFPHYDWGDPNVKHGAILSVRTRPSAVLSAIFTGPDQLRSLLVAAMISVAVLFLLVEIVALVIGVSLSRRITRAINELYEGTRRVIYGDFRHRVSVRGDDQLAELTTSFNQMTGNVERLLSIEKEKERLQAELEIAREVQTQLYPRGAPPACGLKLTVHCEPARMVSGDYYDYETIEARKLAFAIGDVAGKGISAALLMATVQAALRAQIRTGVDGEPRRPLVTARLVSELNRQLYAHTAPEKYATFFFAMYDDETGTLTYTNAGHLPPVLIREGNAVTLDINGTVVGAFPASLYEESRVELKAGDLLVCYTDGITEPENAYGEMFGEERLIDLVKRCAHEDDQVIIGKVIEAVRHWHSAAELPDDMTLLIARCGEAI
jgi:sigma-B regulation protein RsbU (phosphoserine phosphatase)